MGGQPSSCRCVVCTFDVYDAYGIKDYMRWWVVTCECGFVVCTRVPVGGFGCSSTPIDVPLVTTLLRYLLIGRVLRVKGLFHVP